MKITKVPVPATILPKRMIGAFHANVTLEESASNVLEITQHPVQQGASITDHAYVKPVTLTIKTIFSDQEFSLLEIYEKLIKLQASRILLDVVTGKRIYKNMLINSLSQTTDASNENILAIDFSLQEVLLTAVEIISVPERERQRFPERTAQTITTGQKQCSSSDIPYEWQEIVNKP